MISRKESKTSDHGIKHHNEMCPSIETLDIPFLCICQTVVEYLRLIQEIEKLAMIGCPIK